MGSKTEVSHTYKFQIIFIDISTSGRWIKHNSPALNCGLSSDSSKEYGMDKGLEDNKSTGEKPDKHYLNQADQEQYQKQ